MCICWRNKIWYPTSTHPSESPSRIKSFFTKSFTLLTYRDCNYFFCKMNQFFIIYVLQLNLKSTVQGKLIKRNAVNSTKNEPQKNRNKLQVYNKIFEKLTVSIWFKYISLPSSIMEIITGNLAYYCIGDSKSTLVVSQLEKQNKTDLNIYNN